MMVICCVLAIAAPGEAVTVNGQSFSWWSLIAQYVMIAASSFYSPLYCHSIAEKRNPRYNGHRTYVEVRNMFEIDRQKFGAFVAGHISGHAFWDDLQGGENAERLLSTAAFRR